MKNYKMTLAYDGRHYMGFNTSKNNPEKSIQGKLESILNKLYGQAIEVIGAIDTAAGVHAKFQVVNFVVPDERLEAEALRDYFEAYLPSDIITYQIEAVDDRFHSRYLVRQVTYEYRLWKCDAPNRPCLNDNRSILSTSP